MRTAIGVGLVSGVEIALIDQQLVQRKAADAFEAVPRVGAANPNERMTSRVGRCAVLNAFAASSRAR